jgi:hypothetical protein
MRVKSAINVIASEVGTSDSAVRLNFNPITTKALPSDENITWTRPYYNEVLGTLDKYTYYWNRNSLDNLTITGTWSAASGNNSNIPGAIYYNKAGFDPFISTHDNDTGDHITVEPSGLSG